MATLAGLGNHLVLGLRTGWRGLTAWVVGLLALMALTTTSVASVHDTPAALQAYARMTEGAGMKVLSGDVAGVDTLGGVMANEFGQIAAFAIPLMAVGLVVRGTRGEEQAGRTALLLAGRTGRLAPMVATLLTVLDDPGRLGRLFTAVGQVPAEDADATAAVVLVVLGLVMGALGAWGFRRRDLPRA